MMRDWQRIETAPKGKFVLVYHKGWYPRVTVGYQFNEGWIGPNLAGYPPVSASFKTPQTQKWIDELFTGGRIAPTHWMPLPESPTQTRAALQDIAAIEEGR